MTPLKFANKIRKYTKQDSNSLTDTDILLLANPAKDEIAQILAERDIKGNYFIVPTVFDFTANQREYAQPDDVLDHIFSVEFAFNQNSPIEYTLCTPDDFRRFGVGRTEVNINSRYSNAHPCFEIQRRAIYLLSGVIDATTLGGATVSQGGRIRYRAYPADLNDLTGDVVDMSIDPSTTTFGMPRQLHELWARRCSIEWKGEHPGAVPLSPLEQRYEQDLDFALSGLLNNDLSGEIIATLPSDGWNGYNL